MHVYTTDNALNDKCIQHCRLVQVDAKGWAKVAVGKHHRFVPPANWDYTVEGARDKLKDQVSARLTTLLTEAQSLKRIAESFDDLPVIATAEGTHDAGPALGLEALL